MATQQESPDAKYLRGIDMLRSMSATINELDRRNNFSPPSPPPLDRGLRSHGIDFDDSDSLNGSVRAPSESTLDLPPGTVSIVYFAFINKLLELAPRLTPRLVRAILEQTGIRTIAVKKDSEMLSRLVRCDCNEGSQRQGRCRRCERRICEDCGHHISNHCVRGDDESFAPRARSLAARRIVSVCGDQNCTLPGPRPGYCDCTEFLFNSEYQNSAGDHCKKCAPEIQQNLNKNEKIRTISKGDQKFNQYFCRCRGSSTFARRRVCILCSRVCRPYVLNLEDGGEQLLRLENKAGTPAAFLRPEEWDNEHCPYFWPPQ